MNTEAKTFYRALIRVVGPIALQNLISATVNSADVIMLGYLGQTEIAASSLANQVQFILFMLYTGISSGLVMLAAQYWGKKDLNSLKTLFGIAMRISGTVGLLFACLSCFGSRFIMSILTNEEHLIETGAVYLRAVGLSYLFQSFAQIFQAGFKSIERLKVVSVMSAVTLILNVVLNAAFIFGLAGLPKLGIMGVGIATTIARVIELLMYTVYAYGQKDVKFTFGCISRFNGLLTKDFIRFSLPAIGNELVWGLAFSAYSVILGHLGEDIVAARSIVNVIFNLAAILCFGMAYGGAVVLGKTMGAGDMELAERNAKRLVRSSILTGVIGGISIILMKPLLPYISELTETATYYSHVMIYVYAASIVGAATNTVFICGVFRAGGDARFGLILDSIVMWLVSLPLGYISAFVLKLDPIWVFVVLYMDEFEKMIPIIIHYCKKGWLRNITR